MKTKQTTQTTQTNSITDLQNLLKMMDDLEWQIAKLVSESSNKNELLENIQHDTIRLRTMSRIYSDFSGKNIDDSLPFSLHVEVYGLSTSEKKRWLTTAKIKKLRATDLRKLIRKANQSPLLKTDDTKINLNQSAKEQYKNYAKSQTT